MTADVRESAQIRPEPGAGLGGETGSGEVLAPPGPEDLGDVTSRRTRFFINETGRRGRMRSRPLSSCFPPPSPFPAALSISSLLALPLPEPWKGSHFRWGVMAASRTVMAEGRRR